MSEARYYKKEIPNNRLNLPNGKALVFEMTDPNDFGFIKTEDAFIIEQCENAIRRRVGGVRVSNEAEYTEFQAKKKEWQSQPHSSNGRENLSAQTLGMLRNHPSQSAGAVAADGNKVLLKSPSGQITAVPRPDPIEVVSRFPKLGSPTPVSK